MQVHSVLGHNLFSPSGKLMVFSGFLWMFREGFCVAMSNIRISLFVVSTVCMRKEGFCMCRCVLPVKRKYLMQ